MPVQDVSIASVETKQKSVSSPSPKVTRNISPNKNRWRKRPNVAEEKALIQSAVAGDQNAFEVLHKRYYGQVFAFCMRMLNGRSDVEDAVQQVFLECWRSLYRFEGRSLFSTWLIKIAIHTCLSTYRKNSRMVLSQDSDNPASERSVNVLWASEPRTPDDNLTSSSKRRIISRIIDRMTIKKKTVFILSDIQGMTAPEISGILGIPDATVRTRLFHARKEFQTSVNRNPAYRDLFDSALAKSSPSEPAA